MVSSLLSLNIANVCKILGKDDISTLLRVKLYELLRTLIQVNDRMLLAKLKTSSIVSSIIKDYNRYEWNSNVLLAVSNAVKSIITVGTDGHDLLHKLLVDDQLLVMLAQKLQHNDFLRTQTNRKDIYPFIFDLTRFIQEQLESSPHLAALLKKGDNVQAWCDLKEGLEESDAMVVIEWGQMKGISSAPNDTSKDVIRRHDQPQGEEINQKAQASTTRKIIQSSLNARQKLAGFDNI